MYMNLHDGYTHVRRVSCVLLLVLACTLLVCAVLLAMKLDNALDISWAGALTPLWVAFVTAIALTGLCYFKPSIVRRQAGMLQIFVISTLIYIILCVVDQDGGASLSPLVKYVPPLIGYGSLIPLSIFFYIMSQDVECLVSCACLVLPWIVTFILMFLVETERLDASAKAYLSPMIIVFGMLAIGHASETWHSTKSFLEEVVDTAPEIDSEADS